MTRLRPSLAVTIIGAFAALVVCLATVRTQSKAQDLPAPEQNQEAQPPDDSDRASQVETEKTLLRTFYLELMGVPPSAEEVRRFVDDQQPLRVKLEALINQERSDPLYGRQFVELWLAQHEEKKGVPEVLRPIPAQQADPKPNNSNLSHCEETAIKVSLRAPLSDGDRERILAWYVRAQRDEQRQQRLSPADERLIEGWLRGKELPGGMEPVCNGTNSELPDQQ